jgi:hypothetical protein
VTLVADDRAVVVVTGAIVVVRVDDVVVVDADADVTFRCGVPGVFRSAACVTFALFAPFPPPSDVATRRAMSARDTARITHQVGFPRALGVAAAAP